VRCVHPPELTHRERTPSYNNLDLLGVLVRNKGTKCGGWKKTKITPVAIKMRIISRLLSNNLFQHHLDKRTITSFWEIFSDERGMSYFFNFDDSYQDHEEDIGHEQQQEQERKQRQQEEVLIVFMPPPWNGRSCN